MQKVASDVNKLKRWSFLNFAISEWDRSDCLAGDELEQRVQNWLSPPDPWKNHNIACKSSHRGSADWFIRGGAFSEWKASEAPGSLLWVHGKRTLMPRFYAFAETEIFVS
jgi:hypothetical protein